ncbi:MAG: hypothetical protein LIP11_01960, partial [Clostridiales bacterium]|nr:hypothetical protein [Clostridiales bacterium]
MKSSRRAWLIFAGCCMIGLIYTGLVCNTAGLYFNDMAADLAIPMAKVALTMSFLNGGGLLGMAFAGKQLVNGNVRVILTGCAAAT